MATTRKARTRTGPGRVAGAPPRNDSLLAEIRGTDLEVKAGLDAADEAFRLADVARASSVQRALAASSARAAARDIQFSGEAQGGNAVDARPQYLRAALCLFLIAVDQGQQDLLHRGEKFCDFLCIPLGNDPLRRMNMGVKKVPSMGIFRGESDVAVGNRLNRFPARKACFQFPDHKSMYFVEGDGIDMQNDVVIIVEYVIQGPNRITY